jgi:hypothetical protein
VPAVAGEEGSRRCPSCDAAAPDDVAVCRVCGTLVPRPAPMPTPGAQPAWPPPAAGPRFSPRPLMPTPPPRPSSGSRPGSGGVPVVAVLVVVLLLAGTVVGMVALRRSLGDRESTTLLQPMSELLEARNRERNYSNEFLLRRVKEFCTTPDKVLEARMFPRDAATTAMWAWAHDTTEDLADPSDTTGFVTMAPGTRPAPTMLDAAHVEDLTLAICVRPAGFVDGERCDYVNDYGGGSVFPSDRVAFTLTRRTLKFDVTLLELRTGGTVASGQVTTDPPVCPQRTTERSLTTPLTRDHILTWVDEHT